jgi:hypothetical protein
MDGLTQLAQRSAFVAYIDKHGREKVRDAVFAVLNDFKDTILANPGEDDNVVSTFTQAIGALGLGVWLKEHGPEGIRQAAHEVIDSLIETTKATPEEEIPALVERVPDLVFERTKAKAEETGIPFLALHYAIVRALGPLFEMDEKNE